MAKSLELQIQLSAIDKLTGPLKKMLRPQQALAESVQKTQNALKNFKGIERQIQSYRNLSNKTQLAAEKLTGYKNQLGILSSQLRNTTNPTKQLTNSIAAKKRQIERAGSALGTLKNTLDTSKNALESAKINTNALRVESKRLGNNITSANNALAEQRRRLGRINEIKKRSIAINNRFRKSMELQANIGFVGIAGYATGRKTLSTMGQIANKGIDFEQQMSSVAAVARVDKTSDSFFQLNELAKKLGASTQFSATEAAGGMQFLAMAGFEVNEILASMPGILALAKSGNTDFATTADIASNILSGFSLDASEMARVSNTLAATFTRSNVDLTMLGETMKYVAPIAEKYGASVEEVAAMTGLLGNVGIQGSQAGTALRSLYKRMAKPPKPALEALEALNIEFKDLQGNTRPMTAILAEVAQKTQGLGSADKLGYFVDIAGTYAGAAMSELVSQGGAGEITKFVEILKNASGEAQRIASQQADNTAGDITRMKSAWEGLTIALTETNTSPLRDMIQQITQVIDKVNLWIQANPQLAQQIIKSIAIIGLLASVAGGFALTVASILGPLAFLYAALRKLHLLSFVLLFARLNGVTFLLQKSIAGLGMVVAWLGRVTKITAAMQWLLNIAMAANPIGILIGLVTALAAGAYALYANWDKVVVWFGKQWDWLKSKMQPFINLYNSIFGDDETKKKMDVQMQAQVDQANAIRRAELQNTPMQSQQKTQITQNMGDIVIHAAPGQSEEEIAKQVQQQFQAAQRDAQALMRGNMSDLALAG